MEKIFYLRLTDQIEQHSFSRLLNLVSSEKQEQVKRYHYEIDKKLSLYSELLVRGIACCMLDMNNNQIIFQKEEYGKPYIKDYPNFYYNLSHTRNAIAVAIADVPVGVDIEKIRKNEMGIANRFFTTNEQAYIDKHDSEKDQRFCEIWTKKEAYIKYHGKGLTMPLNSFDTLKTDIDAKISTLQIDDYIISVCDQNQKSKFEIITLTEEQVESGFFLF